MELMQRDSVDDRLLRRAPDAPSHHCSKIEIQDNTLIEISSKRGRRMLFDITKQLEHGTTNLIVARLTVQPQELLNHTKMTNADQAMFIQLSLSDLSPRLLRCSEIEQRLRKEANERRPKFKRIIFGIF
jgi:hypothetical protein